MDRNVNGKDGSGQSIEDRKPHRSISKPDQKSLQTAYDFTPIGIVQSSMDGKHIYANAEFCRILGYEREELLHRGMDDVTYADDFLVEKKLIEQLGTGEIEFYKLEKRYIRKDGEIIWVELTRSTVRNSRGKALHTIGVVLDITERKRTEEALTRAREQAEKATDRIARLQQITAALTGVATTVQMAQTIFEHGIRATGASAGILVELVDDGREIKTVASRGYPPAAVSTELVTLSLGTPLSDCILKKRAVWIRSQQDFEARYPKVGKVRRNFGIEAAVSLPLIVGNRVLGGLSFSFIEEHQFESEDREFFLAVAQQCAQAFERALSEQALRESESMLADAQRIARIGSWRWDIPSGRLRWSDGLYAIYGVDRKNFSPTLQSFADYIHPDDRQIVEQKIEQLSSTGAAVDFEFRICSETGETLVLRAVGQVTEYDNAGKPLVIIGANHDVTEQKRAEEALRDLNLQLERRVEERTAELQEANVFLQNNKSRLQILAQRLVEVQEGERRAIAQELHDRVGQSLLALRLNLTSVRDQLSKQEEEHLRIRLADSIDLAAEVMTVVRDVMSNLRPTELDDYGLEAVLKTKLDNFSSRFGVKSSLETPGSFAPHVDPSIEMTLFRISQEALANIAKHAQASEVALSLWQDEATVYLTVEDNGIGFDVGENEKRHGVHGLMIMRERAEAVHGNLQVSSMIGQGTKIEVSIPLLQGSQNQIH
jgi:PAS domain S-box-containing protein